MLNIVCVDANYLFLTSIGTQLKNLGYTPILTTNPKTALLEMSSAERQSIPIHALITGFQFPGFYNAIEFCKKAVSEFPSIFITVLTIDSNIRMKDFGSYQPDVLLNKFGNYQKLLFDKLKELEDGLTADYLY